MLLVTVPIVVLCPLELLHEAEALQVELADFWVTELPFDPAKEARELLAHTLLFSASFAS